MNVIASAESYGWLVSLGVALGGPVGYAIKSFADSRKLKTKEATDNTALLWQTIGKLEHRLEMLEKELTRQRLLKHDWQGVAHALHLEKIVLCNEVNDLLEKQGQPQRYELALIKSPHIEEGDPIERHQPSAVTP